MALGVDLSVAVGVLAGLVGICGFGCVFIDLHFCLEGYKVSTASDAAAGRKRLEGKSIMVASLFRVLNSIAKSGYTQSDSNSHSIQNYHLQIG